MGSQAASGVPGATTSAGDPMQSSTYAAVILRIRRAFRIFATVLARRRLAAAQLDGGWLPWANGTLGVGIWAEGLGAVVRSKSIHPRLGLLALGPELVWRRAFRPGHGPRLAVCIVGGFGVIAGWLVVDSETHHATVAIGGRARASFAVELGRAWWLALSVGFDTYSRPLDGSRWLETTLGATRYLKVGLGVTWAP